MEGSDSPPLALRTAALIAAAGRGHRMGGRIPKQFRELRGEAVLTHTLRAFAAHPEIAEIVVVRHVDDDTRFQDACPDLSIPVRDVLGSTTRAASVRAGLEALGPEIGQVLIHDAARPLVSADVIDGVLHALRRGPAAAPALPVTDALWRGAGTVTSIEDRTGLWSAQTPQGFHLDAIRAAHAAHPGGAADDAEVAHAFGLEVQITQGDARNLKITTAEDFDRAAHLMAQPPMDIRTGNGFDVHRFGPGDHVMLCGVAIPHNRGLQGHSDADVGLHTITDAIYGALAAGDIGTYFPPSDPQWKGAESRIFLTHAVELAARSGLRITHVDLTLICERPRIQPYAPKMQKQLSDLMGLNLTRISVKATTSERLGFTGRGEGIAALATVTMAGS
ncbi:MAG: bifunctional 2-C-methyl-D-erythritol 4-phosphate cytidylyltransferase/2-C-methyl-D-erythritol 2,4-cyclodiphosphate synthase [Rhodobacteraceae bacterium]|nr:bifunctional 2-C-methyl-D-erythritol 4-phosphate cytidylyltransferase/2-C-methyl-D-erythritol 2,4-cyclodiphosphate synthase [Paracoccaceae bacterium]